MRTLTPNELAIVAALQDIGQQKIGDPSLFTPDLSLTPNKTLLWTSNLIQRTISHMYGLDRAANFQRAVSVDATGRIFVNTAAVPVAIGATAQVAMGAVAVVIAAVNAARREILITNSGAVDVWIGFNAAVTNLTGQYLARGATFATDLYVGGIWGITAGAAGLVTLAEF
jgi:hypothetical protein